MDEVRHVPEITDIEKAVMRRAVVAAKPRAVHAKRDVQVLKRDVVNDHVVSALHEGRVNREERLQSLGRQAAGEKRRVFLGDPDIEVARRMLRLEKAESRPARHRGCDGDDVLVGIGELGERLAHQLGIGRRRRRRRFAAFDFVFSQAVEFVRLRDRGLVTFAFLGQNVEQHRLVLGLQEFEGLDQERNVVAIDRPVIAHSQLLENYARHEQILHALLDLVRELDRALAGDCLDETARLVMEARVSRVGDDVVQITGDRAHVFGDRPFVVVQHDDETARLRFRVVQRFVTDPAGEGRIARHHHHVFIPAAQIAADRHPEPGGQSRAGMSGAITIMFAFAPQEKAVQPLVLSHGADAVQPAGKHLVHVTLVADVENELVLRRFKDAMQRNRQLDDPEVRAEVTAGLRKNFDQLFADFLRELRQVVFPQRLDVRGRANPIQKPGRGRRLRRV